MTAVMPAVDPAPAPEPRKRRRPQPAKTPPASPPGTSDNAAALLSSAFTMIAIVCLWMAAQMLFLGSIEQHRAQDLLYKELRYTLAMPPDKAPPVGPVVPVGDPVALLTIPDIGLEQVVVEGTASGDLLAGPGHRRDTPLPGQVGTSVVYGRAATYGAPFGHLTELQAGDRITVVGAQGEKVFTAVPARPRGRVAMVARADASVVCVV